MSADPIPTNQARQTRHTLNGVDLDQLHLTVDMLKKSDDEASHFVFRAHNRWLDGGHNQTQVKDFALAGQEDTSRSTLGGWTFEADEPPVLLGHNFGANPVEYALTALASCLTTSMILHAAVKGIELEQVEAHLEGDLDIRGFLGLDPNIRNGYKQIRVSFAIKAPDATPEQLEEMVRMAQERSPVYDIVTHAVPVEVRLAH